MVDRTNRVEDSDTALETIIYRLLERDAQALPPFGTVPNSQLAAQLASHAAAKGIFATLGSKLGLFVTGLAVIGAAAYMIPKLTAKSDLPKTVKSEESLSNGQPMLSTPPQSTVAQRQPSDSKSASPRAIAGPTKASPRMKSHSPKLPLDEADDKNAPTITDPGYQPALK